MSKLYEYENRSQEERITIGKVIASMVFVNLSPDEIQSVLAKLEVLDGLLPESSALAHYDKYYISTEEDMRQYKEVLKLFEKRLAELGFFDRFGEYEIDLSYSHVHIAEKR